MTSKFFRMGKLKIVDSYEVEARTLDGMSSCYGPFDNVVLWIDIEHAELQALQGAKQLFEDGQILMVNLETYEKKMAPIVEYLAHYGLKEIHRWNSQAISFRHDIIFSL